MVHQLQVTTQRERNKELHGAIMSKNEMLGHLVHSKPNSKQFDSMDIRKDFLHMINDFKADMNGAINTISNGDVRGTISGIFGKHIVILENKIYSLEEEIK
jgi:hypothetical protein